MRLSSEGVHDIKPYVSLFVVFLFQKLTPGNILISYGGNGMEEGDGSPLLSTTITGALSYQYLEEECGALLLGGHIEKYRSIKDLEARPL